MVPITIISEPSFLRKISPDAAGRCRLSRAFPAVRPQRFEQIRQDGLFVIGALECSVNRLSCRKLHDCDGSCTGGKRQFRRPRHRCVETCLRDVHCKLDNGVFAVESDEENSPAETVFKGYLERTELELTANGASGYLIRSSRSASFSVRSTSATPISMLRPLMTIFSCQSFCGSRISVTLSPFADADELPRNGHSEKYPHGGGKKTETK